ncbi:MAG: lytic murein transglycosylase [Alphaproteobacteria bacterium]|nr:lytic murein transglycosylase [Alphaproteobacteria bacterium]
MKKNLALLLFVFLTGHAPMAMAQDFNTWVDQTIKEAVAHGIRPQTAYDALSSISYDDSVIEKDQKQPENTITAEQYWKRIVTKARIDRAKAFYHAHHALLQKVGNTYGVQPRFIVALLSIESQLGEVQGTTPIIQSLASLSYQGRRTEFFKTELFNALKILDGGHIAQEEMIGSWAGAMGWCQFMPSSYLKYAQDFDGDGRMDIWNSVADAAASAANYLHNSGWKPDETWGRQVSLTQPIGEEYIGRTIKRPMSEWTQMGVRSMDGKVLPVKKHIEASLIMPDGGEGPAFLVYSNFNVIMQWNKSSYFATSVGMVADRIGR